MPSSQSDQPEGSTSRARSASSLILRGKLIKQGAEARIYKIDEWYGKPSTAWPSSSGLSSRDIRTHINNLSIDPSAVPESSKSQSSRPLLLKHRFPKRYRHPTLDNTLTRSRVQAEARSLLRCLRSGIRVPNVLMVDLDHGLLGLEYIDGWSVRELLGGGAEGEDADDESVSDEVWEERARRKEEAEGALDKLGIQKEDLMTAIGQSLGQMHANSIIHGDLTTSNMMLLPTQESSSSSPRSSDFEVVLIDFGLSSISTSQEDMAVDLYVLERAFSSTHPASEKLFQSILDAYAESLGEKKWKFVRPRLEDVRLRGRKRDMTG